MKFLRLPSIELLSTVISFNEKTGIFTWIFTNSNSEVKGTVAGSKNTKGYIGIKVFGINYKAHRLAWLFAKGQDPLEKEIDHIDLNKENNKIDNLRLATRKQNNENIPTPKNNTSGKRGVSFDKRKNFWCAYIYHNKKRRHIGYYSDFEEACMARSKEEQILFTHHAAAPAAQPNAGAKGSA